MSATLRIRSDQDVPAMAVDVVSPDLRVVGRIMLAPGREAVIEVPSDASFLRAHLPSGSTVILKDPGNLHRLVTRQALAGGGELPNRREFAARPPLRRSAVVAHPERAQEFTLGRDAAYGRTWLVDDGDRLVTGARQHGEIRWTLEGPSFRLPALLRLARPGGELVRMRVPGNARSLSLRVDAGPDDRHVTYRVRIETAETAADAILNYLTRGDYAAAEAMLEWAAASEDLLASKMQDPYAASVGAYLLLNQRNFAQLHDWAQNLATRFEFLPDGCVIWAWQLLLTSTEHRNEIAQDLYEDARSNAARRDQIVHHLEAARRDQIAHYLFEAARRGVPVYRYGTRLLLDGLKLLGVAGREADRQLKADLGVVVHDSPLTLWAVSGDDSGTAAPEAAYDVAFGPVEDAGH